MNYCAQKFIYDSVVFKDITKMEVSWVEKRGKMKIIPKLSNLDYEIMIHRD